LEEALAPVAILVEEEQEILEIDLMIADSLGQVLIHEVQDIHLVLVYYHTISFTI